MTDRLWTSEDPQPEDLDEALERMDGWVIEEHPGGQKVTTRLVVDLDGEDAARLSRIVIRRGTAAREVLSELLREADRPAA